MPIQTFTPHDTFGANSPRVVFSQGDPTARSRALSSALLARELSNAKHPVSWVEAISKALTPVVEAYAQRTRSDNYNKALVGALNAGEPWKSPDPVMSGPTPGGPGSTGGGIVPADPGLGTDPAAFGEQPEVNDNTRARMITGSPNTASFPGPSQTVTPGSPSNQPQADPAAFGAQPMQTPGGQTPNYAAAASDPNRVLHPAGVPLPGTGGNRAMIAALLNSGNPDVIPMAAQMQYGDIQRRQKMADMLMMEGAKAGFRAPTVRDFTEGTNTIPKQWVPGKGWVAASQGGPRFNPASGGPTLGQKAGNTEVATARQQLEALRTKLMPGETLRQYVTRMGQSASATGRPNAEHDPLILGTLKKAMQRRVGDDPGYDAFLRSLDEAAPQPEAAAPAQPAEQGPGFVDRAKRFLGIGGDEPAGPRANAPGGQTDLPRGANGKIDAGKMVRGRAYTLPDGSRATWDGSGFVPVR